MDDSIKQFASQVIDAEAAAVKAMSAAIEAAELMEHFQWLEVDESRAVVNDPAKLASVGEELADVLCYCLSLANTLQLDVSTILRDKLYKNDSKYPAPRQS